jgi:serine/threonine-protein kinase HipA
LTRTFEVTLADSFVGWLVEGREGEISFRFDDAYKSAENRPVLGQKFEDDLDRAYRGKDAGELPAFFDNLLPGGRLRTLIEDHAALAPKDDLGLLAVAATDLPGAIGLRRSAAEIEIEGAEAEGARPRGEVEGLHFSLTGNQLKFSMVRDGERFVLPASDVKGDWIVKTSDLPGLVENEYAMLEWARRSAFEVPEARIAGPEELEALFVHTSADVRALAVRRYDRDGGRAIHQEDFCQVFGIRSSRDEDAKYRSTFDVLASATEKILGVSGAEELLRRVVFTIAIGNNDAHLKNWSLLYSDGVRPDWSPVYDQVSTIAWPKYDRKLAMKLGGQQFFNAMNAELVASLIEDRERGEALVAETLAAMAASWGEVARLLEVPHREAIESHWSTCQLLKGVALT